MRLLLVSALLLASCASAPKATETQPTDVSGSIEASVAPLLAADAPPALVVGVWRGGETTWSTFGEQAGGVGADSLFRVASLTKPLVGLLVASYVAEGALKYDDRVGVGDCDKRKVSAFCFRGAPTTYQHLVQHTAGLPTEPDNLKPDYARADLQDFLARQELLIQPGARFRYSTTGYAALGMTIERVTRAPLADSLQLRVVEPLGLGSTTFTPEAGALVPGHVDGKPVEDAGRPQVLWPSGGYASTPADLLRFAAANLRPDEHPSLAEAIRLTQRVSSDVVAFDTSRAALGWFHFEALDTYWHAGSAPGYSVFVAFSPRTDTAVVMLANSSLPEDGRMAKAAFELLGYLAAL